eukprot:TRINITY_DN34852_c0_g1_i4.p1 TRINITY_DN34852_c0_g1~~TRINITY_DN34852_c0_g1_i4.p1  ORF type:complete len:1154 (-),score=373.74 TRINITY_DN34852_c0_g1_i4:26-3487(-)
MSTTSSGVAGAAVDVIRKGGRDQSGRPYVPVGGGEDSDEERENMEYDKERKEKEGVQVELDMGERKEEGPPDILFDALRYLVFCLKRCQRTSHPCPEATTHFNTTVEQLRNAILMYDTLNKNRKMLLVDEALRSVAHQFCERCFRKIGNDPVDVENSKVCLDCGVNYCCRKCWEVDLETHIPKCQMIGRLHKTEVLDVFSRPVQEVVLTESKQAVQDALVRYGKARERRMSIYEELGEWAERIMEEEKNGIRTQYSEQRVSAAKKSLETVDELIEELTSKRASFLQSISSLSYTDVRKAPTQMTDQRRASVAVKSSEKDSSAINDFVLHHRLLDLVVKLREQMRWAEFEKTRMKQEVGRVRKKWEQDRKKMQEEREQHHKVVADMEYSIAQLELKAASGHGFKSGDVVAQEEDWFLKLPRNVDPDKLKKLKEDIDRAYERVLRFVKDVRREMKEMQTKADQMQKEFQRALENKKAQFMMSLSEMERDHFDRMKGIGAPAPRTPTPIEQEEEEEEEEEEEVVYMKPKKRIVRRPVFQRSTDFFAFIRKPHRKEQLLSIEKYVSPITSAPKAEIVWKQMREHISNREIIHEKRLLWYWAIVGKFAKLMAWKEILMTKCENQLVHEKFGKLVSSYIRMWSEQRKMVIAHEEQTDDMFLKQLVHMTNYMRAQRGEDGLDFDDRTKLTMWKRDRTKDRVFQLMESAQTFGFLRTILERPAEEIAKESRDGRQISSAGTLTMEQSERLRALSDYLDIRLCDIRPELRYELFSDIIQYVIGEPQERQESEEDEWQDMRDNEPQYYAPYYSDDDDDDETIRVAVQNMPPVAPVEADDKIHLSLTSIVESHKHRAPSDGDVHLTTDVAPKPPLLGSSRDHSRRPLSARIPRPKRLDIPSIRYRPPSAAFRSLASSVESSPTSANPVLLEFFNGKQKQMGAKLVGKEKETEQMDERDGIPPSTLRPQSQPPPPTSVLLRERIRRYHAFQEMEARKWRSMDRAGETTLHKLLKQKKTSPAEKVAMVRVLKTPRKGSAWLEETRGGKELSSGTPRLKTHGLLEGTLVVKGSQKKKGKDGSGGGGEEEKRTKSVSRPISASDFRQAAKDHISIEAILAMGELKPWESGTEKPDPSKPQVAVPRPPPKRPASMKRGRRTHATRKKKR